MASSDPARRRPDNSLVTPHKPGPNTRFGGGIGNAGGGGSAADNGKRRQGASVERTPPRFSADNTGGGGAGPGSGNPPRPPRPPARRRHHSRRWKVPLLAVMIVVAAAWFAIKSPAPTTASGISLASLRKSTSFDLPTPLAFPDQDTVRTREGRWVTRYAPDIILQARTQRYVAQYHPEGAVVVVCDLRTGQIRALVERDSNITSTRPRLALGTTFPAASLAKIVTAAAVLEQGIYNPHDDLPLLGGAHTLYRAQLRVPAHGRYNTITLREAFARSVNPTFGLLGLRLGSAPLREMAERLGFTSTGAALGGEGEGNVTSLALPSQASLNPPDSGFALAEVASGYTTATTLSPLHALRIARAIGQDGRLLPVRFTRELQSLDNGRTLTLPEPEAEPFASPATLRSLRTLMEATVSSGTARRGFRRNMDEGDFTRLDMGGKTGSLNGHNPPGRYEWFIGYARRKDHPDQGIAVAVMLINRTYLAVHATELAGLVIRDWARYSVPYPDEDGRYLAKR